jgi:hypothetical protein
METWGYWVADLPFPVPDMATHCGSLQRLAPHLSTVERKHRAHQVEKQDSLNCTGCVLEGFSRCWCFGFATKVKMYFDQLKLDLAN